MTKLCSCMSLVNFSRSATKQHSVVVNPESLVTLMMPGNKPDLKHFFIFCLGCKKELTCSIVENVLKTSLLLCGESNSLGKYVELIRPFQGRFLISVAVL